MRGSYKRVAATFLTFCIVIIASYFPQQTSQLSLKSFKVPPNLTFLRSITSAMAPKNLSRGVVKKVLSVEQSEVCLLFLLSV